MYWSLLWCQLILPSIKTYLNFFDFSNSKLLKYLFPSCSMIRMKKNSDDRCSSRMKWNEVTENCQNFFFLLMMIAEGSRLGWHKKAILFSPAVDLNHDDFCRNVLWLQSCAIVVVRVAERLTADPNDLGSNPAAAELLNWSSFSLKLPTNFGLLWSEWKASKFWVMYP